MELCVFNDLGLGGRFQLHFQNGVLLLSPLSWPTQLRNRYYYRIDASHSPSRLVFDELGNIYVETVNGTRIQPQGPTWGNSSLDPKGYYYRATLEFNGVFTQYAHPRTNNAYQGWTIMRFVPDNICTAIFNDNGSSSCGYNSYCSTENNRSTCKCPYGYSLVDANPVVEPMFKHCQKNYMICTNPKILNFLVEIIKRYSLTLNRNAYNLACTIASVLWTFWAVALVG